MIVGGTATTSLSKKARNTYLRMVQNVQLTGVIANLPRVDNPIIGFSEKDARCLHHAHDDTFIVSIRIGDYNTYRVLVDNGSFVDILYYPAFQQMRIDKERLVLTNALLVRFGGTKIYPFGTITLPVMIGDHPQQITRDVTFLVIDCSSTYNAIIGRPTLNLWKVVTSTNHLRIKFPTEYKVGELQGEQVAARECYITMLEMDNHLQTMSIEE